MSVSSFEYGVMFNNSNVFLHKSWHAKVFTCSWMLANWASYKNIEWNVFPFHKGIPSNTKDIVSSHAQACSFSASIQMLRHWCMQLKLLSMLIFTWRDSLRGHAHMLCNETALTVTTHAHVGWLLLLIALDAASNPLHLILFLPFSVCLQNPSYHFQLWYESHLYCFTQSNAAGPSLFWSLGAGFSKAPTLHHSLELFDKTRVCLLLAYTYMYLKNTCTVHFWPVACWIRCSLCCWSWVCMSFCWSGCSYWAISSKSICNPITEVTVTTQYNLPLTCFSNLCICPCIYSKHTWKWTWMITSWIFYHKAIIKLIADLNTESSNEFIHVVWLNVSPFLIHIYQRCSESPLHSVMRWESVRHLLLILT